MLIRSRPFCVIGCGTYWAFPGWSAVQSGIKNQGSCQFFSGSRHLGPIIARVIVWLSGFVARDSNLTSYKSDLQKTGWLPGLVIVIAKKKLAWFPGLVAVDSGPEFCFYILFGHCPLVYSVSQ